MYEENFDDNNDDLLLGFLQNSKQRIAKLINNAKGWRSETFDDYVEDLQRAIKGATARLYGTKMMQLGHERSHLNIFLDVGMDTNSRLKVLIIIFLTLFKKTRTGSPKILTTLTR